MPRRGLLGASVRFDVTCDGCGGANIAQHRFCGWCGVELSAARPGTAPQTEITPLGDTHEPTFPGGRSHTVEPTNPGVEGRAVVEDATVVEMGAALLARQGLAVVLLGKVDRNAREEVARYRLELDEPFDVDGPNVDSPGTFTATVDGLRLDSLGDLEGVYVRVGRGQQPVAYRRLRVIRELGTFQALAPGETIPLGVMAILDQALVRIEAA